MKHNRPQIRVALKQNQPYKLFLHDSWVAATDIIERWIYTGQWWIGEHEAMFWRLQLEQGQVLEICQDLVTKDWWLYKVWD